MPRILIWAVANMQQSCRWLITAVMAPQVAPAQRTMVFPELTQAYKHQPPEMDALIISQWKMSREEHMDTRSMKHSLLHSFRSLELQDLLVSFVSHSPGWIILLETCAGLEFN